MSENKVKIEFAPGCFDDFDGSPEELAEMIAQLNQMVEDGTLFELAEPVSEEEAEEIWRKLESRSPRQ
jgi:Ser-tRNA(Ala) deacylase AlaX